MYVQDKVQSRSSSLAWFC